MSASGAFSIDQVILTETSTARTQLRSRSAVDGIGWASVRTGACYSLSQGSVSTSSRLLWTRESRFELLNLGRQLIISVEGGDGLVAARHLGASYLEYCEAISQYLSGMFGYRPTVYMPKVSSCSDSMDKI